MSDESSLWIEGEPFTVNDLTFREQRTMRDLIEQLAPGGDPEAASEADYLPAFITVVRRRKDAEFTVEQALDMKPSDLDVPPTKPAAKKK